MTEVNEGTQAAQKNLFVKKGPHELAAQALKGLPFYSDQYYPNSQGLFEQAKDYKARISKLLSSGVSDQELQHGLDEIYTQANQMGMVKWSKGDDTQGVHDMVKAKIESSMVYGSSEDEAEQFHRKQLERTGYVGAIRDDRKWNEGQFNKALQEFDDAHPVDPQVEAERIAELHTRTFHLENLTTEQIERLKQEFPGGNFLFHGSKVEPTLQILGSGELVNYKVLYEKYKIQKEGAGGDDSNVNLPPRNSGYEGVSWSFNNITAVPGDRYHIVGFAGSPNHVLPAEHQLAVPSRPAPFELIQISGNIDADKYYTLKREEELYIDIIPLGEYNSVFANLLMVNFAQKFEAEHPGEKSIFDEPRLYVFARTRSDDEITQALQGTYSLDQNGNITFSSDLYQQYGEDQVPLAAVWLQALIDTGRISFLPGFEDVTSVRQGIQKINPNNVTSLLKFVKQDSKKIENQLDEEASKVSDIRIPLSDLFFVTSTKDLPKWLKVMARCDSQPRGILVYDHNKVRLENFATEFRGDSSELTEQIKLGIQPDPENGWIDWEKEILGEEVSDDKLAGHQKQVIAEKYLDKRKAVRKTQNGNLEVS